MASNLRVDSIVPSTSGNVSIGTATGGVTIPGNLGIAGALTYEDVTNIDSVGVITARSGIRIGATGANTLIRGNATGIGIGTDNPDDKLTVRGSNGSGLRVGDGTANVLLATGAGPVGRLYTISNHDLIFGTNDSERLRIDTSGNATFNTGNIIIGTAGKGIDYSAQTASGIAGVSVTSEILVHYEEGTFTPFLSASSSAPSVSYGSERGGKYTRIGNMVFYSLGMQMSSYSGGSGAVYIGGFPYVGSGTPGWDGAHVFRDSGAIGLDSRSNTLGAWMETSAVAGYPILYIQSMSSTSSFAASFVQAGSIQAGRLTVHGQYKIG